jgi:glycosyltransferase involved in cell wall biosynthesis
MASVKLSTVPGEAATWEDFHALAVDYEQRGEPILAFGYYLIAASLMPSLDGETAAKLGNLGYQTGNFSFALQCFILAAAKASNSQEKQERTTAIVNLLKKSGLTVSAAELSPIELDIPPLIDRISATEGEKTRTCLLVAHAIDKTENILLSIPEHSSQTSHVFRFGEIVRKIPMFNTDRFLLYLCRDLAPDMVLFRHAELTWRNLDPRVETFKAIKEQLKIPIVGIYYDLAKPSFERLCRGYLPGLDAVVTLDTPLDEAKAKIHGVSAMSGWAPLPASIYYNGTGDRPIDVGFVGRISAHYRERAKYFGGLRDAGVKIVVRSADDGTRLSIEEMGEFLRSCKIVVNFSSTAVISPWELSDRAPSEIPLVDHVKARVFEATSCGALLLESRNDRTSVFFTPDEHYAEFSDLRELIEKIRYFLANDEHRKRIASAGNQRFNERYTGRHFWAAVEALFESP